MGKHDIQAHQCVFMSSKTVGTRQVRFAVLALTMFMLSVFTPLIEYNALDDSNLESELDRLNG